MKAPDQFNSQAAKRISKFVVDSIPTIEGLEVSSSGGSFDSKEFVMKIKFTLQNPELKSTNQKVYESVYADLGLPEWGFQFTDQSRGESYVMVDYRPRSPKYPIIGQNVASGKKYKFSEKHVAMCLRREA